MANELEIQIGVLAENVKSIKEKAAEIDSVKEQAKAATLTAKEAKEAFENAQKEAAQATVTVKSLQDWQVKKDEADKKNQDALNELIAERKEMRIRGHQLKSYDAEIEEMLESSKDLLKKGQKFSLELNRKAVGDMSASNLTGSYFITPDVRPGIVLKPYEEIHMRNILPIGRTNSNIIRHLRDNGGEGGPTTVAAGAAKPQMDRDLSIEDATVRKIATHLRIPEEMIEDIPYITSFLTNIGTEEVLKVEDAQILYGDGTGQNLSGLFTNATAFAPGATAIVGAPNRFDVLRAGRMQMRNAKRKPSFALVSPTDYFLMTSVKDSTNNYVLQGGGNGLVPSLDGIPIIEHTEIAVGDFLLGDRLAAEIYFRSNLSIRFYEQDQDNAIKNMVTVVIEERLALPIYYTSGFVKGTFSAGITDLTS